jgi:hypothetical protein
MRRVDLLVPVTPARPRDAGGVRGGKLADSAAVEL